MSIVATSGSTHYVNFSYCSCKTVCASGSTLQSLFITQTPVSPSRGSGFETESQTDCGINSSLLLMTALHTDQLLQAAMIISSSPKAGSVSFNDIVSTVQVSSCQQSARYLLLLRNSV